MYRKMLILLILLPGFLFAREDVPVTDASIDAGEDVLWTSDNTYILDGFVFVEDGATLTIEAGTVIKGKPGQGENASALVIARGGKIFANGTPAQPIIFTAEDDDVNDPTDLPLDARGLWGGVILLGNATINVAGGVNNIEGIPVSEPRGQYGGNNDDDNSGVMRFVSIRHGGTNIGANNEINGLTMGAIGRATTIEFIEVFNNADDGFEWFGGTVNTRYLIAAFNDDDCFDYDEGWRGNNQFWFAIMADNTGNAAGEHDGGTTPEDGQPYAIPVIYNATYIGSGAASSNANNTPALNIRDNAGGKYYNSILTDFFDKAVQIEDLASGEDSRARLEAGDLVIANNIFWNFGGGSTFAGLAAQDFVQTHLANNSNRIVDPMLRGISRTDDGGLDPRPTAGSPATTGAAAPSDDFFVQTDYHGAFGTYENWASGWTFLSQAGYLPARGQNIVNVTDASIDAGEDVLWTSDNTYILDGFVFVEDGATLTIEAGTVIKGKPGQGENASALVIARGGKIFANGTPAQPIIFTAEDDDVNDPTDLPLDARGLWGGVILLGNATINVAGGVNNIEGIPVSETRGQYGGNNDDDNSGVMRFVSIRHGGTNIGANNEINGLTMGAIGRATTIEFIEVFNNADDGFEWFGGTVNTRYLIAAFNDDDCFDYDEGWRGNNQFWFAIMADNTGNAAGEHDGGTTPEDGQPYAIPVIYNATYIGSGAASSNANNTPALNIRDNAGGKYYNSILTDFFDKAVQIEDLASGEDSRARLEAGDLVIANNIFWNFGGGSTFAGLAAQDFVQTHLANNSNQIVDPVLRGISRTNDGGLYPLPADGSPTLSGAVAPQDNFFAQTDYLGAFGSVNWATDWTFLSHAGYLNTAMGGTPRDITTGIEERRDFSSAGPADFELSQNYPNPFNPSTNIRYSIAKTGHVKLVVYNQLGQQVATLIDGVRQAGQYTVTWQAESLASGLYFYRLQADGTATTRRMLLVR